MKAHKQPFLRTRSENTAKITSNNAKLPQFQSYYMKSTPLKNGSIAFQTGSRNTEVLISQLPASVIE